MINNFPDNKSLKGIYFYKNYRQYLSDYYEDKKSSNPYFSYRYFSNKAGFKTKDFFYRVIKGERNISRSSCVKISRGIGHSKKEAEFFENLVEFNQAKEPFEKKYYYDKIKNRSKKFSTINTTFNLVEEQFKVFSQWYHLVVRSILEMKSFSGDFEWLSQVIEPKITAEQAEHSVELLTSLGLVKKLSNGKYIVSEKNLRTSSSIDKNIIHGYYQKFLELAKQSIDKFSGESRNVTGMTLGISHQTYQDIVKKISIFRKEISDLVENDSDSQKVYSLQLQLFPVSKSLEDM